MSAPRTVWSCGWVVALLVFVVARTARADDGARARAARFFDAGVAQYERAAYDEAAHSFLRADEAEPSPDALGNALKAARKAGDHLLVVAIAHRALGRGAPDDTLSVRAREALADAATHLSKVELACEPEPCQRQIDGSDTQRPEEFVLPGTHVFTARNGRGGRSEERATLAAGATYSVRLHVAEPGATARPNEVKRRATPVSSSTRAGSSPPARDASSRPLGPGVFYAGVGLSALLVAVTTWSGFDTLGAKHDLGERPTTDEVDAVRAKARRTDVLLGASVLVAAATTYAGFVLVDFGGSSRARVGLAPLPTALRFSARF